MNNEMKLEFDLTTEDWLALQRNFISSSKSFNRVRVLAAAVGPIGFFLILLATGTPTSPFLLFFAIVASVVWVAKYPKVVDASTIKRAKRVFEEGNNSSLLGRHEIDLGEHEISCKEPGAESTIKWSAIQKLSEDQQYMFLYISTIAAIIIPKEKAITSTAKEQVFEYIRSKISRPSAEFKVTENEGRA